MPAAEDHEGDEAALAVALGGAADGHRAAHDREAAPSLRCVANSNGVAP
jgi:hypothetical protein